MCFSSNSYDRFSTPDQVAPSIMLSVIFRQYEKYVNFISLSKN